MISLIDIEAVVNELASKHKRHFKLIGKMQNL